MVLKKAKVMNDFEWRWLFWLGKLSLTSPGLLTKPTIRPSFAYSTLRCHSLVSWEPESWGKLTIAYANHLSLLALLFCETAGMLLCEENEKTKCLTFFPCSFNYVHAHCKQDIEMDNIWKISYVWDYQLPRKIPRS